MNSDIHNTIEQMNELWAQPTTFKNPHANGLWARVRVTICYNSLSAQGLFEEQPLITPVQRLEFLQELKHSFENLSVDCALAKVDKMVNRIVKDVFNCKTATATEIIKNEVFEFSVKHAIPVRNHKTWSVDTTTKCANFMHRYGFKEITRSRNADENMVSSFIDKIAPDCEKLIEKTQIDPYVLGLGSHLTFEELNANTFGCASAYGVMALDMSNCDRLESMKSVFFHEWFHMLDFAAFYAAQNPEAYSPLSDVDTPLRELHKNLIRMSVNRISSVDPYNVLISTVESLGNEWGHPWRLQQQHIKQMKEVLHTSKKDRRENLNTFFHTVVLENKSDGDLYPFIDKGLQTFDVMSAALKGFHKYLQKGYSEFYAISIQMDDDYYHTKRKPLKWYQKRKPYYSKPAEVLARSAEQFCAKELGRDLNLQLGYPQSQEARRAHELFAEFFKQLATVRLTPSTPTRKLK